MSHLVLGVLHSILADELELDQLEELFRVGNPLKDRAEVYQSPVMVDGGKGGKGIPLAGGVGFALEEGADEVGRIGNEGGRVLVDGCDGEDGILAHIGVAVLETLHCGGQEGLDEFGLAELAQEAEGVAADVLVGMLKIVPDTVATKEERKKKGTRLLVPGSKAAGDELGGLGSTNQTRIISCFSLPLESSLGQIS